MARKTESPPTPESKMPMGDIELGDMSGKYNPFQNADSYSDKHHLNVRQKIGTAKSAKNAKNSQKKL
jgi:hypothetical protein